MTFTSADALSAGTVTITGHHGDEIEAYLARRWRRAPAAESW